ncbi:SMP-30/gluconolactonase/LRE family protein [Kordia sp. YSTF-M3]|uniref:SMP-30/gluconolactonase/LRE family protein n=1 Tax=Kordia aestuariivivens TaxID=2759037 RepID=A0ABR7QBK7_9FLAO|nr:SMP-30/gluconolactonase/LRE family protein [Kordia aestuariivivens]MBC8755952.1 SMP-30/gluconolactonase/LRE family protein [Kordia aestuariivivens]
MKIVKNAGRMVLLYSIIGLLSTNVFAQLPKEVLVKSPGLYPEGLVYDATTESFFTTSVSQGKIVKVSKKGKVTVFADDEDLVSTIGLEIDVKRNRLIVCNSDPGASIKSTEATKGKLAAIVFYNLKTGKREKYIDLAAIAPLGGHMANDVVVDNKGNFYITDSFSSIIYKVTKRGKATILINDKRLASPAGTFGLNGLAYHPDGFLIVALYNGGRLFKIPLKKPSNFTEINLGNKPFPTIDGVLLLDDNTIAVACNNLTGAKYPSAVYKVKSTNNWQSANTIGVFETGDTFPTTLTKADNDVFVVYAKLPMLFGGVKPVAQEFEITKVEFQKKK